MPTPLHQVLRDPFRGTGPFNVEVIEARDFEAQNDAEVSEATCVRKSVYLTVVEKRKTKVEDFRPSSPSVEDIERIAVATTSLTAARYLFDSIPVLDGLQHDPRIENG